MSEVALQRKDIFYLMTSDRDDELCPVIELKNGVVLLRDGDNNVLSLTPKHWGALVEKILNGELRCLGSNESTSPR